MSKYLFFAFFIILLSTAGGASAQDFHCYKAAKKDWKSDKKESKIRRKMFHDSPYKASRKRGKAIKKAWKSDMKEYEHEHYCEHHWY